MPANCVGLADKSKGCWKDACNNLISLMLIMAARSCEVKNGQLAVTRGRLISLYRKSCNELKAKQLFV
jgi:hypothetical protein